MVLDTQGKLWAWGDNYSGNLGDGTKENEKSTPVAVKLPAEVKITKMHAAGDGDYSLALDDKGRVWAWGNGESGQLGSGSTADSPSPVSVVLDALGTSKVVKLAADEAGGGIGGFGHSLALDDQGHLWAWGWGYDGELGNGATKNQSIPVNVDLSALADAKVVTMRAEDSNSLALDNQGRIWAWGDNNYGQLGDGTNSDRSVPVAVKMDALLGAKVASIQSTGDSSYALDENGKVWAWGANFSGVLGDGTTTNRNTPVAVRFPVDVKISELDCREHCLALDDLGRVWAWGNNSSGRLGDGTMTSRYAPVLAHLDALMGAKIVDVEAGEQHSIALDDQGRVWGWGYNLNGAVGDGKSNTQLGMDRLTPVAVELKALGGYKVVAIQEGKNRSHAWDEQGRFWSWGYGYDGQWNIRT